MAAQPDDDQELLRLMAKGDEAAFDALFLRYQRPIFRFAWHISEDSTTAEEITQEVFMQLISNPRRYDPAKGSVAGYLFGITRNLTRRSMKNSSLELPILDDWLNANEEDFATECDVLAQLSQTELIQHLRKAVLALPELYREVLILRDLEQVGHRETAELLQCSLGTVASRLHRAMAMLKMKLISVGCAK